MNNINDLYIDVHKKLLDDMHDLYIKKNGYTRNCTIT